MLLEDLTDLLAVFMVILAHHKTIEPTDTAEPLDDNTDYNACFVCGRFIWNTEIICLRPSETGSEECYVCSYCQIPETMERLACIQHVSIAEAEELCKQLMEITGALTDIPYIQEPPRY